VLSWSPGDTIPLGPNRSIQVVRVRDNDADQAPVLVVQDLA
jgi:flagellar biogenesis protein FliO